MGQKLLLSMMILSTFLFLVLASASDFYNILGRTMIDIDRLRSENAMLKSTLNHYEQEYNLRNIRWIQSENLQLLFTNDELERTVKTLKNELSAVKEKLNDLKNDKLRRLINLKTAKKGCECHKDNQNVAQQTTTRMLEHEKFNVLEKYEQHFEAKLEKKKAIYKKIDKIKNLKFGKPNKSSMKKRNLFREKLKTDAVGNSNEYSALVAKCKKNPISEKHFNELKHFLSLIEINKDGSFDHPASYCWMKISESDKLELYSDLNKRIVTFEMKLPVQVKISNEGIVKDLGLPRNPMFELQLVDFKDGAVEMFYLPSNQSLCVLVFRYKPRDSGREYTMRKNERPELVHLMREYEEHKRVQVRVSHADLIVTYMEMDDFAHAIKRVLEQQVNK